MDGGSVTAVRCQSFLKWLIRSLMDLCDQCDSQISAEFMLHIRQIASS